VHVIPAGQVLARLVRAIEGGQGVPGLQRREDLFALNPDGSQDLIHLNDLGNYLVALTHYAVLYHRSPVGLPHQLLKADGTPAVAPFTRSRPADANDRLGGGAHDPQNGAHRSAS
jgi:hypothetical protein